MLSIPESPRIGQLFQLDFKNPEHSEMDLVAKMVREHYAGLNARAAVWMDKDDTVKPVDTKEPTDPRLLRVFAEANQRGIIAAYNSDSSLYDLRPELLGKQGLPVGELGGCIGFPDGSEIHLVQSGEWFKNLLFRRFIGAFREDRNLRDITMMITGTPWELIWGSEEGKVRLPGSQRQLVILNEDRRVSNGVFTALLDQSRGGVIVRGTEESRVFFGKIADLYKEVRQDVLRTDPFPDPGGMVDGFFPDLELINVRSADVSKQKAMQYLSQVLNLPIYYIGDKAGPDDMTQIPGIVTMAVGNGTLKDVPGVIAAQSSQSAGVVELFENHLFPKYPLLE